MLNSIEIPIWLLVLIIVLAVVAFLDRLFMPSVRWYFRRRFNRTIDKLNSKLQLGIKPFSMTKRSVMVDLLAHDPKVLQAVVACSEEENIPREIAMERARSYAHEIIPSFSAIAYFGFAVRITKWVSRALYNVKLGYFNDDALRNVDPNATVVFVMNHRSNMDYVLVTFLAGSRSALSYAVGEWARIWPLKQLIRSMGAYFIRRKSRGQLYRRVLARYVQMATEGGVTQAIFPEGGLSRDGKLGKAKLGLLSYISSDLSNLDKQDILFVPVGVNYDRVIEDRILISANGNNKTKFSYKISHILKVVFNHIWLRATGKFQRFGYASVGFGKPISLRKYINEHHFESSEKFTESFGKYLMSEVGRVVPILPVPLLATVFVEKNELTDAELNDLTRKQLRAFQAHGAHCYIPRENDQHLVDLGIKELLARDIITKTADGYKVNPDELELLTYYANGLSHLLKNSPIQDE